MPRCRICDTLHEHAEDLTEDDVCTQCDNASQGLFDDDSDDTAFIPSEDDDPEELGWYGPEE